MKMKNLFQLSWSLLACVIMLSANGAQYQKHDAKNRVITENDDDDFQNVKEDSDAASSAETLVETTPVSSRIEAQRYLCDKYGDDSHNVSIPPLKRLTDQYLIVTAKSLDEVSKDPRSTLLHMDMYDGANCATLISEALNYVLSGEDEDLQDLHDAIQENEALAQSLETLRLCLSELSSYGRVNFEDEDYSKKYSQSLQAFSDVITDIDNITYADPTEKSRKNDESSFREKFDYFVEFLELSRKVSNLLLVRYSTEKVLSATRSVLEDVQNQTMNKEASYGVEIATPIPGVSANLEAYASKLSQGANALSFCSVSTAMGASAGLTFNILPAKITGKFNAEKATTELFFSLEAYMDYLNSQTWSLDREINKAKIDGLSEALNNRKTMQEREKEAFKYSGTLERYLKMFKAIPKTGVSLNWITVTQAMAKDKSSELSFGAEIDAGISVASVADLGINVKASTAKKEYIKESSLFSMIDEDCKVDKGLTIQDLINIVGAEYDARDRIGTPNNLLGFLDGYVFTLEQLATTESKTAKKRLENDKHDYERTFLERKKFKNLFKGTEGRAGVLKAAILTAALFRQESPDNQEYNLRFKKIYDQIEKLAKLGEFSKNNSGLRSLIGYGSKAVKQNNATASIIELEAEFSADATSIGTITAKAKRRTVKHSPFIQENGKYITLNFSLPVSTAGVLGMSLIKLKTRKLFADAAKTSLGLKDFADIGRALGADIALGMLDGSDAISVAPISVDDNVSGSFDLPGISGKILGAKQLLTMDNINGLSDFEYTWRYVDALKNTQGIEPLPGQKQIITNKKGKWVLDYVTIVSAMSFNGSYLGRTYKITGSNTLHDLTSKFNVLSMGKIDSKSGDSTAIEGLFKDQTASLIKLFSKIATRKGNAAFELQMMYNDLLDSCDDESRESQAKKAEISKLFEDFIFACEDLRDGDDEFVDANETLTDAVEDAPQDSEIKSLLSKPSNENQPTTAQFKKALDLFKKILDKQYENVFKPHYDRAFLLKSDQSVSSK